MNDKVKEVKCPNCGASVDSSGFIDTMFCNYCGTQLLLYDQSDAAVIAKAHVRIAELNHEQKRREFEKRIKDDEEESKYTKYLLPVVILFVIAGWAFLIYIGISNSSYERNEQSRLEALYQDILVDVQNKDYELALTKAHNLYYGKPGTVEAKEWNQRREELIQLIEGFLNES